MLEQNGLVKLVEECGELVQVAAKKMTRMESDEHWDGAGRLSRRLEDEAGDVMAAIRIVAENFGLNLMRINERCDEKLELFREWMQECPTDAPHAQKAAMQETFKIQPENCWREVWHTNCETRLPSPLKYLKQEKEFEEGLRLGLYECTGCQKLVYAGIDKNRHIVTKLLPTSDSIDSSADSTSSGVTIVIVNGRAKVVGSRELSFSQIFELAHRPILPSDDLAAYTITYRRRDCECKPQGTLLSGETIGIANGMVFSVAKTS